MAPVGNEREIVVGSVFPALLAYSSCGGTRRNQDAACQDAEERAQVHGVDVKKKKQEEANARIM